MVAGKVARAQVASARVYRTGCVITYQTEVEVIEGDNTCYVDCLAEGCAEDSIRVRLPGEVSLVTVSVSHDKAGDAEDELADLVAAREAALAHVVARIQNRTSQKDLWLAGASADDEKGVDLQAYEAFLEKLPARLDALDDELAELERQRAARQGELDEAMHDLRELRERGRRGLLRIRLRSTRAGTIACEVVVRSDNATWRPVYDVLVDGFDQPLRLRLRAEVSQDTGWDWEGVGLCLSTASPRAEGGSLPRLSPLRLRKHVAPPAPRRMGMMSVAMGSARVSRAMEMDDTMVLEEAGAPMEMAMPLVEAAPPQAVQSEQANSIEYEVPGTWDIASGAADGSLVEVMTSEVGTSYHWLAVPLLDDAVYMVAVLDDAPAPETVGHEASVYLEGTYCGKVLLDEPPAGKPYELSLGSDTRMRASRRLVRRQASKTLLRGRASEETAYELVVESQRATPVRLVLMDQVPLAEDKDIWVERGELSGGVLDDETGEVRWEMELAPGQTVSRRLAYTVSHPKDMVVDRVHDARPSKRYCPECGAPVVGSTRFCPTCGSVLG